MKKAWKILQGLEDQYKHKPVHNSFKMWKEINDKARDEFKRLKLKVHVELVVVIKNDLTGMPEEAKYMWDGDNIVVWEDEQHQYGQNPMMMSPRIVIGDYDDIEMKKEKAEQAIIEREKRRQRGDSYFVQSPKDLR